MSPHGNTMAPRCKHCHQEIYHTAPGGHWTHRFTENRQCMTSNNQAEPVTRPMGDQRKKNR